MDQLFVYGPSALRNIDHHLGGSVWGNLRSRVEHLCQAPARYVFHDDVRADGGCASVIYVEHLDNVRMFDLFGGSDFVQKSELGIGSGKCTERQEFDGDYCARRFSCGAIHLTKVTATKEIRGLECFAARSKKRSAKRNGGHLRGIIPIGSGYAASGIS